MVDYAKVFRGSLKHVHDAFKTIADSWKCLGLSAEGGEERFSCLQRRLEDLLKESVQGELDYLESIKIEVDVARKCFRTLAAKLHEPLPEEITEPRPWLQQLEDLDAEQKHLEARKERRARVKEEEDSEGELSDEYTYEYSEAEEQQPNEQRNSSAARLQRSSSRQSFRRPLSLRERGHGRNRSGSRSRDYKCRGSEHGMPPRRHRRRSACEPDSPRRNWQGNSWASHRGHSRSASRKASNPREIKFSVEECLNGLELMQGPWVDTKGITYDVRDKLVRRNSDGRTFALHVSRGLIDWGPVAKYFARPDQNFAEKFHWLNSSTGVVAWVWTRYAGATR